MAVTRLTNYYLWQDPYPPIKNTSHLPFRLGAHEPKHLRLRAVLNGLLQQRFQRVPRAVVLLEVGGPKPDGLALGEDGERVREDGARAFERALADARLGILHPKI